MKREELKTVIKLTSCWKVDKRKGNYKLPSGIKLSSHLESIAAQFLMAMKLGIASDGNIYDCYEQGEMYEDYTLFMIGENEKTDYAEQSERIAKLVNEMIY